MKTTILTGFLMICIVVAIVVWANNEGPGTQPKKQTQTTTQSISTTTEQGKTKILCPLSQEILNGQKPNFSYRNENSGQPIQQHMQVLQVAAGINNGKAMCKYFDAEKTTVFSIGLPGNYGTCIYENDSFVGFICT